jgi:hypothetical protein
LFRKIFLFQNTKKKLAGKKIYFAKAVLTQFRKFRTGMGKKGRVKSNPHSKIDPIMPGH